MEFRQLFDQESCTYTYLLACDKSKEAIFIDPVDRYLDSYIQLIKELDLKLVVALDTHVHADHITAIGKLREKTGCQSIMGEKTKAECVSVRLKNQENLSVGGVKLRAIYTPGHTDDSYCYQTENMVFTGDTLLIRGTGRTDFQNGSANAQYDSLFNNILKLPESTFVLPAHDYKGQTRSTIGEEIKFNPRLQVKSEKEYVEIMNNLNLPNPRLMDIAVPANLKCGLI
jgi:sulfur dioxygenase